MIPIEILSSGAFWVTGSFSYLWGGLGCLAFLWPFLCGIYERKVSWGWLVLAVFGRMYSGNLEQSSAIQFVYSSILIVVLLRTKKPVRKALIGLWLLSFISFTLILVLPYNRDRLEASVSMYMPEFYALSVKGKMFQGIVHLYSHLARNVNLMLPFSFLLADNVIRGEKAEWKKLLSLFPIWYYMACFLVKTKAFWETTIVWLCDFSIYRFHGIEDWRYVAALILHTMVLGVELYLLVDLCKHMETKLVLFLFYGAGLFSAVILGFSPTMFASGNRVFLLFNLFWLLFIGILIYWRLEVIPTGKQQKMYAALWMIMLDLLICCQFYTILRGIIIY